MKEFSSFRDPSGYVFEENGILMRKIASSYLPEYRRLIESGLYRELVAGKLLVPHKELTKTDELHGLVIQPLRIPMISYPYEWSFSMIQDAALLTLEIQKRALDHKMILKDASAYNVQFVSGRPVFIDTLSFEEYREGEPWGAYGQFCRHFLAPLLLMAHTDLRLNRLAELFLDGIPLDLASRLLRGKGGLFALIHIHLHARSISRHNQDNRMMVGRRAFHLSRRSFYSLLESLQQKIESLRLRKICTEWGEYYSETNYSDAASQSKESAVRELLAETEAKQIWDFGANDGRYTRIAFQTGASFAAAFDIDPVAVERNYRAVQKSGESLLPLLLDLNNPSPGIGFANRERPALRERGKPDCILMLAILHHLAISNNLPFLRIAEWIASLTSWLLIEFVPKEDSQVQRLLRCRVDIFPDYCPEKFEEAFSTFFLPVQKRKLEDCRRILYLFRRKEKAQVQPEIQPFLSVNSGNGTERL